MWLLVAVVALEVFVVVFLLISMCLVFHQLMHNHQVLLRIVFYCFTKHLQLIEKYYQLVKNHI